MDRSFEIPADSSEFADLPWEAYFDAVLLRSGISKTIPCSSISPSQSLHSSESIPFAYTPLMAQDDEIIDSADNFNVLSSINYHSDSPKFDILDSADAFDALSSSTTEMYSCNFTPTSDSNHSTAASNFESHTSVRQSVAALLSPKKARKPQTQNQYTASPF